MIITGVGFLVGITGVFLLSKRNESLKNTVSSLGDLKSDLTNGLQRINQKINSINKINRLPSLTKDLHNKFIHKENSLRSEIEKLEEIKLSLLPAYKKKKRKEEEEEERKRRERRRRQSSYSSSSYGSSSSSSSFSSWGGGGGGFSGGGASGGW